MILPCIVLALAALRVEISPDGDSRCSEAMVPDEVIERFSNKTNVKMSNQRTASYISMVESGLDATDLEAFFALQCKGAVPALERLVLSSNPIKDEGMKVFAAAAVRGSLKKLSHRWLSSTELGDAGVQTLASAIRSGQLNNLKASELEAFLGYGQLLLRTRVLARATPPLTCSLGVSRFFAGAPPRREWVQ